MFHKVLHKTLLLSRLTKIHRSDSADGEEEEEKGENPSHLGSSMGKVS